jgi:holo-[acyl-carrier protein] synthase
MNTVAGYPEGPRMIRELAPTSPAVERLHLGCDVHTVANVIQSIEVFGDRYLERVFTLRERAECAGASAPERLAGRFAAKESVLKAMRVPADVAIPWTTIEVLADSSGAPTVTLTGQAADYAAELGIGAIEVTLSHDSGVAVAFAAAMPATWSLAEDAA